VCFVPRKPLQTSPVFSTALLAVIRLGCMQNKDKHASLFGCSVSAEEKKGFITLTPGPGSGPGSFWYLSLVADDERG